jgi:ABC-type lipoprotein release transport system permease subunit
MERKYIGGVIMKQTNNTALFVAGLAGTILAAGIGWYFLLGPGMNHGPLTMNHDSTTATSAVPAQQVESGGNIRILPVGEAMVIPQETIDQIKGLNGIKEVYAYLSVKTEEGEVLGVDVNKEFVMESDGKLITPSLVEGRFLQDGDAGKNIMLVGKAFSESHQTDLGYPILGMVSAHATAYKFDNNDMKIVGIFGGASADTENRVVLPLESAQRLYQYNQEQGVNLIYVTLDDSANAEEVSNKMKEALKGSGTVEVFGQ